MKTVVALVGFMASGKSTVARLLAARLNRRLVSTDALIETKTGKNIGQIFELEGEAAFRRYETEVFTELAGLQDAVIDCGGGVVLNTTNILNLKQEAFVIYLAVSPEAILHRLHQTDSRPLLQTGDRKQTVNDLLERRRPLYEAAADFTVDTDELTPDQVAGRIIEWLNKHEG